jgi:diguanylate cyclase (GGDEF)-like protein/PAS domain S-box-containing protein
MERLLAESERWLSSTLHCLGDGVVATDANGRVRFMNAAAEGLIGRRHDEVRDAAVHEFVTLFDADAAERLPDPVASALAKGQPTRTKAGTLRRQPEADPLPVEIQASPIRDHRQGVVGAVLVLRDISERRRAEAALARLAHQDTLTGLPNRAALLPQLEAMASNARRLGSLLAVLFLDLDGFKQVNDSFGHRAGDQLLVQVARRLKEALRVEDFVARLGGDEFVVLAGNLAEPGLSRAVAGKLVEAVGQPYAIDGKAVSISVSVGVSLCPLEGADGAGLLRHADTAMYWAKGRGKNQFALHLEGPGEPVGEDAHDTYPGATW